MKKELYSISEAARHFGISRQRVHALIKSGKLRWHGAKRTARKTSKGIRLDELQRLLFASNPGPLAVAVERGIKKAGGDPRVVCFELVKASFGGADPEMIGAAIGILSRTRTAQDAIITGRLLQAMTGKFQKNFSAFSDIGRHIFEHSKKCEAAENDLSRFDGFGVEKLLAVAFVRFLAIERPAKKRLRAAIKDGVPYDPRIERNRAATILGSSPNNIVAYQRMVSEIGMTETDAQKMLLKLWGRNKWRSSHTVPFNDETDRAVEFVGKPIRGLSAAAGAFGITRRTAYAWRRLVDSRARRARQDVDRCPDCSAILKGDVETCPDCGRMV